MKNNSALILSALSLLVVVLLAYYQVIYIPQKLEGCHAIAVGFEKARHYPVDDLEVTNQDISSYMKNVVSCMVD